MQHWQLKQEFQSIHGMIAYDTFGQGDPLILVHGTPFSSFVWRHVVDVLARTHQVFVYDLLGYGASEKREGQDVSLGIQPRILQELIRFWQLEQPTVIAHDFGGTTSLRAHLLEGCDYHKLLLIDPVAMSPWGSPFIQHVRQHFTAFADVPPYIHSGILEAYLQDAAYHPLPRETLDALKQPWTGETGQPAFYRQIAQMDQKYTDEIEHRYTDMRCPVHIIWGEEDTWIPIDIGKQLHARIAGASFTRIEEAAHLVQEDQPAQLLNVLIEKLGT